MDHYHLKEFSPDQKLFAIIQGDGKLKIWDVETSTMKQEYVPNLHLSTPCTALKWIRMGVGKKKKSKSGGTLYILLGTSQGGLALYSYTTAKIEATFKGNGHSAAVTSIDHDSSSFVYTTGLDSQVIKWNISSCQQEDSFECGKDKPTAICLIRSGQLIVTASKEIKVWDGESYQLLYTFTGHSSNTLILKSFEYGEENFILSAAKNDRNLSLWKIKEDKKATAFGTFILLNNSPNCVDMQFTDEDELRIACICRNESMSYFEVSLKSIKSKKPIKSKFSLEIASSENTGAVSHLPINCVSIAGVELLIGYGDMLMKFEKQPCEQEQTNVVIVRNDPMKFEGSAKERKKHQAINEALNIMTPITDNSAEILNVISAKKKNQKSVEIPLETRLDNLTVGTGKRPNAKKLTYQLIQGLHGSDANILRTVLKQTDEETVRLTVKYLPTQYVMSFVNELSLLMSKKTAGSEIALTWLRYLIQTHSGSLMSYGATNLCNTFGTTLGIIDHRTQNLPKLMRLRGKLEILVSHLKQNSDLDEEIHNENVLVYEDSDDESNIDAKSNGSSDQDVYQDFEEEENSEHNEENGMNGNDSENSEEDEEMDIS